jgi:hypothetical protein
MQEIKPHPYGAAQEVGFHPVVGLLVAVVGRNGEHHRNDRPKKGIFGERDIQDITNRNP